jgi:LDH2 family malate/lactate/ureidoglycolate dehydrogenase
MIVPESSLKTRLITAPVLAYPQAEGSEFILDTDASDYAIGAVLSQVQDGKERVIAYGSRCLDKPERNYCDKMIVPESSLPQ